MFKFAPRILSILLVGSLTPTAGHGALDVSGYFDVELIHKKSSSRPVVRQHHLNLLLQHSVENYKFFAEIEFEDATDLNYGQTAITDDSKKAKQGRLFVERAYGEVTWSPMAHLTVGQMLHTSYYLLNHYPSLTVNFTDPATRKAIFDYNVKGATFWGEYGDFYYDVWTGRGPATPDVTSTPAVPTDTTGSFEYGMDWGAKLAYTVGSDKKKTTFAVLTAEYSNGLIGGVPAGVDRSVGGEVVAHWDNFTLLSEFGERVDDVTSGKSVKANYVIGSYTFTLENGAELSPYLMVDSLKINSDHQARSRNALGLNYKPNAAVTTKFEYLTTNSYQKIQGTDILSDNQAALVFVYFYN